MVLNNRHLKDLRASGLSQETIQASGMYSVSKEQAQEILGFNPESAGLAIPYPCCHDYTRIKPDIPYKPQGWDKAAKYLSPQKSQNKFYFPATLDKNTLQDASKPLMITEGEKKVLKANQEGFSCIGVAGVWNWSAGREQKTGQRHVIPDVDRIQWDRRNTYLVFDSDAATNPQIQLAEKSLAKELQARGANVKIVRLPSLPELEKTGVDDFLIHRSQEALNNLINNALPYEESPEDGKKISQTDRLVSLALEDCELFSDALYNPYALVYINGHSEILRVVSREFRRFLSRLIYETDKKVPSSETISNTLNVLEAKAVFDGEKYELYNRVAWSDDNIWYDLTDRRWRAVLITEEGWQIVEKPPILFTRYRHQECQVDPLTGGDAKQLFDFIAVADDDSRLLLLVFLIAALVPNIPHPVPVLHGPQGAGKSSCFRVLRKLVDPSAVDILSFPRDTNDLVQKLSHHWFLPFDNVTNLQTWQSDALCRAVTGEGFIKRQLYTDDEDVIYTFRRVIGLNGINVSATRADLLDRSILIGLERINPKKRRTESDLWNEFEKVRPGILGGMFDALSKAMKIQPSVKLTSMPRMADFAKWGCAIAQALGYTSEDFLRAYGANIEAQNEEVLQGNPVAAAMVMFMEDKNKWQGAPSELLKLLVQVGEQQKLEIRAKVWPKAANSLMRRLNEIKPNLVDAGIHFFRQHGKRTEVHIYKDSDNIIGTIGTVESISKEYINSSLGTDDICDGIPTIQNNPDRKSSAPNPNKNNAADDTDDTDDNMLSNLDLLGGEI